MKRKILTVTLSAAAALALSAGPAVAHVNVKAGTTPDGLPAGFVGPADLESPAHNGIECAAAKNPNIDSIARFNCPADR